MKRKRILIVVGVISILIIAIIVAFFLLRPFSLRKEPLKIAVVRPGRDASGEAMVQGIRLYLDTLNQSGGINGRKIQLLILDDDNDERMAINAATEAALENKTLLVLGHYWSSTSIVAGDIYRKNGVPVITASATAEAVTRSNDWYFSIIPNNRIQAEFMANYIKYVLKRDRVSLIVDADNYGSSLAEHFTETAKKLDITIPDRWDFNAENEDFEDTLTTIIGSLRAVTDPGVLLFATHQDEAVKILTTLNFPGTTYTIMGPDAFAASSFIETFRQYPQEQFQPGYYSDGIYAISPFMGEIAGVRAHTFKQQFVRRYGKEPSWVAAYYYDAMRIAAEAIERAEIGGEGDLQSDRKKIRGALAQFNNYDSSIEGVTGRIYFNTHGSVERPFAVGTYQRQRLLPSFSQYRLIAPIDEKTSFLRNLPAGEIIHIAGKTMKKTDVVYTGIDINSISNLHVKDSLYTVDFYLWFRFQRDFDDAWLEFPNATHPITLVPPMIENTVLSSTRIYRVNAEFTSNFDFQTYPFDQQVLRVAFHHGSGLIDSLMYIPDVLGMSQEGDSRAEAGTMAGWNVKNISTFQDVFSVRPEILKLPLNFSQFNAEIRIERQGWDCVVKAFFPLGILLIILYLMYFLPPEQIGIQWVFVFVTAIAAAVYHNKLISKFPSNGFFFINYAFFTLYGLAGLSCILLFMTIFRKQAGEGRSSIFIRVGRVLYPIIIGCAGILLAYAYYIRI